MVGEFAMFPAQIGGNKEPLETYKASWIIRRLMRVGAPRTTPVLLRRLGRTSIWHKVTDTSPPARVLTQPWKYTRATREVSYCDKFTGLTPDHRLITDPIICPGVSITDSFDSRLCLKGILKLLKNKMTMYGVFFMAMYIVHVHSPLAGKINFLLIAHFRFSLFLWNYTWNLRRKKAHVVSILIWISFLPYFSDSLGLYSSDIFSWNSWTSPNRGFHKLHEIGNNANIGIRGFTMWKQKQKNFHWQNVTPSGIAPRPLMIQSPTLSFMS